MIIRVPYGSRPGEKIVSEGFFACPFCNYKRPYARKKVVKVNYWGIINIPSNKALMEYIHCGGCLNVFPIDTIEPQSQLKVKISEHPLPPESLFDEWQVAYQSLQCEELLANNPQVRMINTPLIKTSADQMQKAGVSINLKMVNTTKNYMLNILNLSDKWFEFNIKDKNRPAQKYPLLESRHKQFSATAHYILSKLP